MNLSAITDFPSLCVEYISISLFWKNGFSDLLQNLLDLSAYILNGLSFEPFNIFWKELLIEIPFLSFKKITHAYYNKLQQHITKISIFYWIYLWIAYLLDQHPKYCL